MSEICREFGCLPSESEAELAREDERDDPLLFDILDLRHFVETKRAFDDSVASGKPIENPSPMMPFVWRAFTQPSS